MQSLYGAIANYKLKKNMAISVDKGYQKVLALANKEQRGYITPQEFNLFADHAQMDIFEQYFYDLQQRKKTPGTDSDYADIVTNIEEKISIFEVHNQPVGIQTGGNIYISSNFPDLYRLNLVQVSYVKGGSGFKIADEIQQSELRKYENSPLAIWTKTRPVYVKSSTLTNPITIKLYPNADNYTHPISGNVTNDSVNISYIKKPKSPNWTYVIGTNKSALYNPSAADHQDFELHPAEENNLVFKILQLAGIAIKDFQLAGVAAQEEMKDIQQEKI